MHLRIRRKLSSPHALLTNFTAVADMSHIVGNKAKGRISKRVFQENRARQVFQKRTFLTPIHTRCVSGGKKCSFLGKFGFLCFLQTPVSRLNLWPYYPLNDLLTVNIFIMQKPVM